MMLWVLVVLCCSGAEGRRAPVGPKAMELATVEQAPPENWSPLVSAARSVYRRSFLTRKASSSLTRTPLLSAVKAVRPQASVVSPLSRPR